MASITARRNLDKKAEELFKETHCKYCKRLLFRVFARRFHDFDSSRHFSKHQLIDDSSSSITLFVWASWYFMYYCLVCLIGLPKGSLSNRSVKVFDHKFENMTAELIWLTWSTCSCAMSACNKPKILFFGGGENTADFSSIAISVYSDSSYRSLHGSW